MDIQHNNQDDLQDQEFEIVSSNETQNKQQNWFDHVVCLLQQIVICEDFEKKIHQFMKDNWSFQHQNSNVEQQIFSKYQKTFTSYLNQKLAAQIPNFNFNYFYELLSDRKNQIDQQILDTLESLVNLNSFTQFIRDYKTSYEQIETYRVLTIKSNKIPENKTVKGKDNIFGGGNVGGNPLFDVKMKKPRPLEKKQQTILSNKTEQQLLVPDLVLTVKGIRKA